MTDHTPIYSGEAVLLNWHDAKSGRKIVLQLEKYAPGAHPFDGLDGERFAVVIVGPLAPAEHGQVARKGKGDAPTREDGECGLGGGHAFPATATSPTKPKRHWRDMPPSQRAALRVKEPEFWVYITESHGIVCRDEHVADRWLKTRLGITSKADLATDERVANHFDLIDGKYLAWRQARGHGVI